MEIIDTVRQAVKDIVFYYDDVLEERWMDGSFTLNYNENGDTIWQGTTYSNGDFRSLMISCRNITESGKTVSAYIEAMANTFDNDYIEMIGWLNSEEVEDMLTKQFERNWRAATERK